MTTTQEPPSRVRQRTMRLSRTADGRTVPSAHRRMAPLVRRLDRRTGWIATLAVTALAGLLRFWNLGRPEEFLFDETYYAKDAWSLLDHGYVRQYVEDADKTILNGNLTGLFLDGPSMIVHPEVGKWLIALGEKAFGNTEVGWRVPTAIAGTLMVLILLRVAYRLFHSIVLAGTAGGKAALVAGVSGAAAGNYTLAATTATTPI